MLKLENLTKTFGDKAAVNDLTLAVGEGEILGFLGLNGAGKTTTLRMIAGVLGPTSGTITVNGSEMARNPDRAKEFIGYVPDTPELYSKLTGTELLEFALGLHGEDPHQSEQRINSCLEQCDLMDVADNCIESYSQGMKTRLSICAALCHSPKVLLLDEPTMGLDPKGVRALKIWLRRCASDGMAIVLSSHSLQVVEELADSVALIHTGSLRLLERMEVLSKCGKSKLEDVFLTFTKNSELKEEKRGLADVGI